MKYIFIALFLILPFSLNAQTGRDSYTLLEPLPCVQSTGNDIACDTDSNTIKTINTQTYILYLYRFSFSFAAALAVVMIILGGFQYALSDSIFTKSEASSRIKNAVVGLLMLLGSYLILETIDPRLVEVKSTLDPVEVDIQKIDYGKFLGEVDYATYHQQLTQAQLNAANLRKQASDLRAQANAETDPVKKEILNNEARELDWNAKRVTSLNTADILYKNPVKVMNDKGYTPSDFAPGSVAAEELKLGQESLSNSMKENIQVMIKSGDVVGADALEKKRLYLIEAMRIDATVNAFVLDLKTNKAINEATGEALDIDLISKSVNPQIEKLDKQEREKLKSTGAFSIEEVDEYIDNSIQKILVETKKTNP